MHIYRYKKDNLIKWVTHHIIHALSPKVLDVRGCIEKNSNLTLVKDNIKIKYISERDNSHPQANF